MRLQQEVNSVVDSSTILALVFREKGSDQLADLVKGSLISAVNLAEVSQKMSESGMTRSDIEAFVWLFNLSVEPLEAAAAIRSGLLRADSSGLGLSLADCACLDLASSRQARVLTADRAWTTVDVGVEVVLIR